MLFALLVALGAWYVQFRLFRTNGAALVAGLLLAARAVLDRPAAARHAATRGPTPPSCRCRGATPSPAIAWKGCTCHETPAHRSCSRWPLLVVAAAGAGRRLLRLLRRQGRHQAVQQGVAGRPGPRRRPHRHDHGQRLQGRPKEFAIVIPVPTVLEKEQIHVGDKALLDHLDAYSAPRLVEYFDANPCDRRRYDDGARCAPAAPAAGRRDGARTRAKQPRRDDRGAVHGRRVRHPDPLGQGERRARDLAARERLPDPAGRRAACSAATSSRTCVLRRQGEPRASRPSSASPTCARCRSPTSRRSSCCRSASAW